jgi:hypothetical protein
MSAEGAVMRRPAVVRSVIWFVLLGLILFSSAGTLAWPQAWVFLALFILCSVGMGVWLNRLLKKVFGGAVTQA